MADLATIIPTALGAGGLTWAGQAALSWLNGRGEQGKARIAVEAELEKHRDSLTFEVLNAANAQLAALHTQLAAANAELVGLRPMEAHFYHLQQALDHIEALRAADPNDLPQVSRAALAFVKRMRRLTDAQGDLRNEAQAMLSGMSLAERGAGTGESE